MTLVTLDCRPFDIAISVSGGGGAVYSPAVLLLRTHSTSTLPSVCPIYEDTGRTRDDAQTLRDPR
jgi:hypothetical protein